MHLLPKGNWFPEAQTEQTSFLWRHHQSSSSPGRQSQPAAITPVMIHSFPGDWGPKSDGWSDLWVNYIIYSISVILLVLYMYLLFLFCVFVFFFLTGFNVSIGQWTIFIEVFSYCNKISNSRDHHLLVHFTNISMIYIRIVNLSLRMMYKSIRKTNQITKRQHLHM